MTYKYEIFCRILSKDIPSFGKFGVKSFFAKREAFKQYCINLFYLSDLQI